MKKYLRDMCDQVARQLKEKHEASKNEAQVMTFEQSAAEDCCEAMLLITEIDRLEQEEKVHLEGIRIAEIDYQEQFGNE